MPPIVYSMRRESARKDIMTITIKDCINRLPQGSDPLVVTLHVAATAPERHESRVQAAAERVREAYPAATDEQLAAILALEAGGVGGRYGYSGGATRRMNWATDLGNGRSNAIDGGAWTAAIGAAAALLDGRNGNTGIETYLDGAPSRTADSAALLVGDDLEWPLAHALRCAADARHIRDTAASWAEVARQVAARCEPDSAAGRLARRYDLETLRWLYVGEATLRGETVAEMLGVREDDLAATPLPVSIDRDGATVELLETARVHVGGDPACAVNHDAGWRIRLSTRDVSAAEPLLRRAWAWRDGVDEHDALVALHQQLMDGLAAPEVLTRDRVRWEAEDAAMSDADGRVAERVADLPETAREHAAQVTAHGWRLLAAELRRLAPAGEMGDAARDRADACDSRAESYARLCGGGCRSIAADPATMTTIGADGGHGGSSAMGGVAFGGGGSSGAVAMYGEPLPVSWPGPGMSDRRPLKIITRDQAIAFCRDGARQQRHEPDSIAWPPQWAIDAVALAHDAGRLAMQARIAELESGLREWRADIEAATLDHGWQITERIDRILGAAPAPRGSFRIEPGGGVEFALGDQRVSAGPGEVVRATLAVPGASGVAEVVRAKLADPGAKWLNPGLQEQPGGSVGASQIRTNSFRIEPLVGKMSPDPGAERIEPVRSSIDRTSGHEVECGIRVPGGECSCPAGSEFLWIEDTK